MPDRPIIFSAPMVRALLAGQKTQTRRVLKPQPEDHLPGEGAKRARADALAPYATGDRLWVREAHYLTDDGENEYPVFAADQDDVSEHLASMQTTMALWPSIDWSKHLRLRPSIHMPRWASRMTLGVTEVRVQRLQEISEEDAIAEGCRPFFDADNPDMMGERSDIPMAPLRGPEDAFRRLWNSLHGPDAWDANPWVAAITFTVEKRNIDA